MNLIKSIAVAGLFLAGTHASAGLLQPAEVTVDLDNMFAAGDMVTARFADEPNVFIGCGTRNTLLPDGTLFEFGFCQGDDAEGDFIFCNTFNTPLVDKIGTLADFSFIFFAWQEVDDGQGGVNNECTAVGVSTQSLYVPDFKKPRD